MDCNLFSLLIQKYHDGELDRAMEAKYEKHLAGCEKCEAMDARYSELFSAFEKMEIYQPPEGFNGKVMANVNIRKYRKNLLSGFLSLIARRVNILPGYIRVASAVTAAFALFMYIFRPVFMYMISVLESFVGFASSSAYLLVKQTSAVFEIVVNYFNSDPEFLLAATILLRKSKGIIGEISGVYLVAVFLLVFLIVVTITGVLRSMLQKGESHVSFI
ncbi:MAG TPA: zf-HC2 domain-containing protein [Candidatus Krumholzibacteriaceae bacterium]|nr:zf-HC2 domain-containing protein [Candidatus Krumholzibacteriaceae bacterium]